MLHLRRRTRRRTGGFTLIEVLLVLVILVILGSMAVVSVRGVRKKAHADAARSQISAFEDALGLYDLNLGRFPATQEGLQALRTPPDGSEPYLTKDIPLDPWGTPYQYELVDSETYRIWSLGPDGIDGTEDDISNL